MLPMWILWKKLVLDEYHEKPYVGYPGYENMITTIKKYFFWASMKKEVEKYLSKKLRMSASEGLTSTPQWIAKSTNYF